MLNLGDILLNIRVNDSDIATKLAAAEKRIREFEKAVNSSGMSIREMEKEIKRLSSANEDLANRLKKVESAAKATDGAVKGLFNTLKTLGVGAMVKAAFHAAETGLQAKNARQVFESRGDMQGLRDATYNMIDDTTLAKKANYARTLGINPEQFQKMALVAKAAAASTGQSVEYMFDSVVIGSARMSKPILDNLGIIVSAEQAQEKYAASIGKTASKLTEYEKKQAFINEVLRQGTNMLKDLEASGTSLVNPYEQLGAAVKNLAVDFAGWLDNGIRPAVAELGHLLLGLRDLIQTGPEAGGALDLLSKAFKNPAVALAEKTIDADAAKTLGMKLAEKATTDKASANAWGGALGTNLAEAGYGVAELELFNKLIARHKATKLDAVKKQADIEAENAQKAAEAKLAKQAELERELKARRLLAQSIETMANATWRNAGSRSLFHTAIGDENALAMMAVNPFGARVMRNQNRIDRGEFDASQYKGYDAAIGKVVSTWGDKVLAVGKDGNFGAGAKAKAGDFSITLNRGAANFTRATEKFDKSVSKAEAAQEKYRLGVQKSTELLQGLGMALSTRDPAQLAGGALSFAGTAAGKDLLAEITGTGLAAVDNMLDNAGLAFEGISTLANMATDAFSKFVESIQTTFNNTAGRFASDLTRGFGGTDSLRSGLEQGMSSFSSLAAAATSIATFSAAIAALGSVVGVVGIGFGGLLIQIAPFAGALAALTAGLAVFGTQTESYARWQAALALATKQIVRGFEPFFSRMLPLAQVLYDFSTILGLVAKDLLPWDGVVKGLYTSFNALLIATTQLQIGFYNFQIEAMIPIMEFVDQTLNKGKNAQKLAEQSDYYKRQRSEAAANIERFKNRSFDDANAEMLARLAAETTGSGSVKNGPKGFKVESFRYRAEQAADGSFDVDSEGLNRAMTQEERDRRRTISLLEDILGAMERQSTPGEVILDGARVGEIIRRNEGRKVMMRTGEPGAALIRAGARPGTTRP